MISRVRNLLRLNKLYGLFRDYIETRDKKILTKMWDVLQNVTEFKELIARERMEALKGNKTYIVAAIAGLATVAKTLGYIDEDTYTSIMGFLAALGGATLAAKVNRSNVETNHKINTLLNVGSNPLAIPMPPTKEQVYTPGFPSAGTSQSVRRDPYKKG